MDYFSHCPLLTHSTKYSISEIMPPPSQPTSSRRRPDLLEILRTKDEQIAFLTCQLGNSDLVQQVRAKDDQIRILTGTVETLNGVVSQQQRQMSVKGVASPPHNRGSLAPSRNGDVFMESVRVMQRLEDELRITQMNEDLAKAETKDWERHGRETADKHIAEIGKLSEEADGLKQRLAEMKQEATKFRTEIADLRARTQRKKGHMELRREVSSLTSQRSALRDENAVLREKSSDLSDQLFRVKRQAHNLRQEVANLTKQGAEQLREEASDHDSVAEIKEGQETDTEDVQSVHSTGALSERSWSEISNGTSLEGADDGAFQARHVEQSAPTSQTKGLSSWFSWR